MAPKFGSGRERAPAARARTVLVGRQLWGQRGLRYVLVTSGLAILVGGAVMAEVEASREGAPISSIGDGLWWALPTVTTVGYGDEYPTTKTGRVVAAVLMVVGIALFGVVAGTLSSLFAGRQNDEVLETLRRIEERLTTLERRDAAG